MAIIAQDFEVLVTGYGTKKCDFDELLARSKKIRDNWDNDIVINKNNVNFSLNEDLQLEYKTNIGEKKKADITQFAFSQLCSRMGVPANYIKKCFKSGKEDLALDNFRAWSEDTKSNVMIRSNNGIVRAVLSDNYVPFDSYQVLRNLKYTVDFKRWELTQAFLSEDKMVLRFVDFTPLPVNDGSPLYLGFTVSSSDVGQGSLNVKMMLYRSVCANGLLLSEMGGTLYRKKHSGKEMAESKMAVFNRILSEIDEKAQVVIDNINECRNRNLQDFELEMLIEKARRDMKLSAKSVEKLKVLVNTTYERTKWGVINGVTELAQDFTLETRLEMETWAGELFLNKKVA